MRGLVLALVIAALIGLGVYVTFVNPSYVPAREESFEASRECVEKDPALEEDPNAAERVSPGDLADTLAVRDRRGQPAFVFFFDSEEDAQRGEGDLMEATRSEFARRGFSRRETNRLLRGLIDRRGFEMLMVPVRSRINRRPLAECIVAFERNRWDYLGLFDTRTLGHPFTER